MTPRTSGVRPAGRARLRWAVAAASSGLVLLAACGSGDSAAPSSAAASTSADNTIDSSTAVVAPSSEEQPVAVRPTAHYIAICTKDTDNNREIQYLNATSGDVEFSYDIVDYDGAEVAGDTDSTNDNQQGTFEPTLAIRGSSSSCGAAYFNADLSAIAGIDKYPSGDAVPASLLLESGTVTDAVAPADHTGFQSVDPVKYEEAGFSPKSSTLWWLDCNDTSAPRLVSDAGVDDEINDPGTQYASGPCAELSSGPRPFVFSNSKDRPLIVYEDIPAECGAKLYACRKDVVPVTDLAVGSVRISDNDAAGSFVACVHSTFGVDPECSVYTIPLSGGEPTKIVDLDPQINARVIRYVP